MRVLWISVLIILVDQFTKIWIRTTMYVGESVALIDPWLRLTFTENPGMAFGLQLGSTSMVTGFSIIATFLIILYLWQMKFAPLSYRASIAVVLGGAIGNIIDRVFYGKLFAYADLFSGQVVDFIHVDIWRGVAAEWLPLIGGRAVALFPIWNVADMAIVLGVIGMLSAQHRLKQTRYAQSGTDRSDKMSDEPELTEDSTSKPASPNQKPHTVSAPESEETTSN